MLNYFFVQAIEENESVAKAWFRRGSQLYNVHCTSIQSHSIIIVIHPYLLCLGEAHLALNDCEAAKADFEKTFQLDPENKVLLPIMFYAEY